MPSDQIVYQPNPEISKESYVSSFEQYQELYKESIENPQGFWGKISKQFHWETPPNDPNNIFTYNFDISQGPIFIKWLEGASTNICYNLLDKNVKNGNADTIAFHW